MKIILHKFIFLLIFMVVYFAMVINIAAQDYLVSFAGSGSSTTVSTVIVENLTQGTYLTLNGTDKLHLKAVITDVESVLDNKSGKIDFFPNPMKDYTKMQFLLPVSGVTLITLYDFSGRGVSQSKVFHSTGKHIYNIAGLEAGVYFVRISCGKYSYSGRFISSGIKTSETKIVYENTLETSGKYNDSKGPHEEIIMKYNTGDRLLIKGISGLFSTVITNIPKSDTTFTFNFIPCTDGDGNNYSIIQAGSAKSMAGNKAVQTWMAENLRTTKYNDGKSIPEIKEDYAWIQNYADAFCWYNNDIGNKGIYGALYNWYAIDTKKLCPVGWHVPTESEWLALVYLFGGLSKGNSFKETGTIHWPSPNDGTNESGFTGLPGGYRYYDSGFRSIGYIGLWFGSNDAGLPGAPVVILSYDIHDFSLTILNKRCGFSVRCLKD